MRKIISRQEVLDFMRRVAIMNIAANLDGEPIASVLLFTVDNDFIIHCATHKDTYKARALDKNPRISFCIWEHKQMQIQGKGRVEKVDPGQINLVLDGLAETAARLRDFWPPILSLEGDEYVIYRIKPDWIRILDLSNLKINERDNVFTRIKL